MRYKVVFSETAARDLSEIFDYVAAHGSADRAIAYLARLQKSIDSLKQFPNRGSMRDDLRPGLRAFGFEHRIAVAFEVGESEVTILRVLYGGRELK